MKDIIKFELSVLIEKNKSTNERKLTAEIEKLLSKNSQLREIKLIQIKKTKLFILGMPVLNLLLIYTPTRLPGN